MKTIIVDIETGGFSGKRDMLTQIAALVCENNKIIDKFNMFCLPQDGFLLGERAIKVNGHTIDVLKSKGKPITLVLALFYNFLYIHQKGVKKFIKPLFVAHNVKFDKDFLDIKFAHYLRKEISPLFRGQFDTVEMFRVLFPALPKHKLEMIFQHVFNDQMKDAHDAGVDVDGTFNVIKEVSLRAEQAFELSDDDDRLKYGKNL